MNDYIVLTSPIIILIGYIAFFISQLQEIKMIEEIITGFNIMHWGWDEEDCQCHDYSIVSQRGGIEVRGVCGPNDMTVDELSDLSDNHWYWTGSGWFYELDTEL